MPVHRINDSTTVRGRGSLLHQDNNTLEQHRKIRLFGPRVLGAERSMESSCRQATGKRHGGHAQPPIVWWRVWVVQLTALAYMRVQVGFGKRH